ncbi:MAG: hypothetical protein WB471_08420 [Nocardioides sp.]
MRDPEKFDAFYKDARERLLGQTFALTGDLAASRRAVRHAFVVAWHHWRKLSTHTDPESVVRPHAWRLAQRQHTARVWHRDKDISPEVRATLDALGKLSAVQRRTLVLTQLAVVSMPQIAREVGIPLEAAERELQHATTQLALQLDVQTPAIRSHFDDLVASVSDTVGWPRATILRRAGAARRRTHTGVGVAATVAALVVSGSVITNATGARPTLDRPAAAPGAPSTAAPTDTAAGVTDPPPPTLSESNLLGAAALEERSDRQWSVVSTSTNDDGTGLVLPCQLERYADPRGTAALVRSYRAKKAKKLPAVEATQFTELSSSTQRAVKAYRRITSWFGDCQLEKTYLISTATPKRVGDESVQIVLRSRGRPKNTFVIAVARTGVYTTTNVLTTPVDDEPGLSGRRASARMLSSAVDRLCSLPDAGACGAQDPVLAVRPPLVAGDAPAMLSELDLPPLGAVKKGWVGTEPRRPVTNDAASACDKTTFQGRYAGKPFTNSATRTFVIPGANLPTEFGLTQTVASLPTKRAAALVERVRSQLSSCDSLNTDVARIARTDSKNTSLTAWSIRVEVTDARTVTFFMAIMRDGTSVSQVGFFPDDPADLGNIEFVALSQRALDRLAELPGPRKS